MKTKLTTEKPLTDSQRQLVTQHLRLAYNMSHHYAALGRYKGVAVEDLKQEACWGLCMAARRYDSRQGTTFQTYAYAWCRKFILTAINEAPFTTDDDAELLADQQPYLPCDAERMRLTDQTQQEQVEALMAPLGKRERLVVTLICGLEQDGQPAQPLKVKEVAARMHLSTRQVRHIYETALAKMEFSSEEQ